MCRGARLVTRILSLGVIVSNSAWASKRYHVHVVSQQQLLHGLDFPIATDECCSLGGKIARPRRGMSRWCLGEPVAYGRKISDQVTGRCIALLGILGEATFDYPAKRRRSLGV